MTTNGHAAAGGFDIPIVDFAAWTESSAEDSKKMAIKFTDACRFVRFVYIVNRGVPSCKIAETFAWSKNLFAFDISQKVLAPHTNGSEVHHGYSWPGLEKLFQAYGDEDDPDLVEKLRLISDAKVILRHLPSCHTEWKYLGEL